jgi:type II secretory pathway pseudopilin PulG
MERPEHDSEAGYMLVGAIVLVFLMFLALSIAAPRIAMDLKRDRELESANRARQYTRAIRIYYQKFKHYPGSVEQLEKTNNQRFLRAKYLDPLTGKDDWRLIHVGENKTKVKGFFGEDLPGLGTGLNAGGLTASTGTQTTGGSSGSAFNNGGGAQGGSNGIGTQANSGTGSGSSTGTPSGTGVSSTDVSGLTGSGGPIMGIGSSASGDAILTVNEQTTYQDWEFLYDPLIEQLYAKGTLLGGVSSGPGASGGFGTPIAPATPTPVAPATPPPQ